MNAKKLTFPKILTLLLVGFLVVGAIYGVVRYLVLLPEGAGNNVATLRRVLWEVIPALVVLLVMYGVALTLYFNRIRSSITRAARSIERAATEAKDPQIGGEWAPVDSAVEKLTKTVNESVKSRENAIALDARRKTEEGIARDMESALAATSLPCVELDFSGAGGAERSSLIAADLFDGFYLGRRTLCFMTADIWGTGFAAARFAARVKELFRDAAHSSDTLGEAVLRLNRALLNNNPDSLALTGFFAVFMPGTGELRYVNAGAHPPVLVGKERTFLRVQPGCPLGLYEAPELTEEYLIFKPGRCLVTYTNGAVEARNGKGEAFGYDRLFDAVKEGWERSLGADRIVSAVTEAVKGFAGAQLSDDVCVYALYYPNPGGAQPQDERARTPARYHPRLAQRRPQEEQDLSRVRGDLHQHRQPFGGEFHPPQLPGGGQQLRRALHGRRRALQSPASAPRGGILFEQLRRGRHGYGDHPSDRGRNFLPHAGEPQRAHHPLPRHQGELN